MLKNRPLKVGQLAGVCYIFENPGDELAPHSHGEDDNHITIVSFGSVEVFGDCTDGSPEGIRVDAAAGGTILDWAEGEIHGIRGITSGATIVNILKKTMNRDLFEAYNPPLHGQRWQPPKAG